MKLSFITNREYREEKVLNWISVGLLFFVTSFIWAPSRDGVQVVFALGFLLPLLAALPFRKPDFPTYGGWFTLLALVFASYAVLTSIWAPISKVSFFVTQWLVLAVWLIGVSWLSSRRYIDWFKVQEFLLLIGVLVGIFSGLIFYGHYPLLARMEGSFAARNPNEVGALFGILTLLAYCQWLKAATMKQSCHYGVLLVLLSIPLLLSQSRGALLALLITGLMAIFYIRPSRRKIICMLLFAIFSVALLAINWHLLTTISVDRFSSGFRDVIWQEVFSRSVNEHLWLGIGMEKFEKIIVPDVDVFHHAHNAWLDTFYHTGLIGLVLALLHVFYVLQKFKPSETLTPLYLWLMFGLIASMFDYRSFFWQIDFKWFLFWIPVGLISAMQIQENKLLKKLPATPSGDQ